MNPISGIENRCVRVPGAVPRRKDLVLEYSAENPLLSTQIDSAIKQPNEEIPTSRTTSMLTSSGEITCALSAIRNGDRDGVNDLMTVTYNTLRRVAAQRLFRERSGHSLRPSDLVQETYLKITD